MSSHRIGRTESYWTPIASISLFEDIWTTFLHLLHFFCLSLRLTLTIVRKQYFMSNNVLTRPSPLITMIHFSEKHCIRRTHSTHDSSEQKTMNASAWWTTRHNYIRRCKRIGAYQYVILCGNGGVYTRKTTIYFIVPFSSRERTTVHTVWKINTYFSALFHMFVMTFRV